MPPTALLLLLVRGDCQGAASGGAHYTSGPFAASGSGWPAPSREDGPLRTGERDTDDSGPPSRSNLVYATNEERIPMDGTERGELRVLDGVRTGGLPRVMTGGF